MKALFVILINCGIITKNKSAWHARCTSEERIWFIFKFGRYSVSRYRRRGFRAVLNYKNLHLTLPTLYLRTDLLLKYKIRKNKVQLILGYAHLEPINCDDLVNDLDKMIPAAYGQIKKFKFCVSQYFFHSAFMIYCWFRILSSNFHF